MFLGDVLLEMIVVLLSALIAEAVRTSILSKRQNDKPLFWKAKHQYLSVLTNLLIKIRQPNCISDHKSRKKDLRTQDTIKLFSCKFNSTCIMTWKNRAICDFTQSKFHGDFLQHIQKRFLFDTHGTKVFKVRSCRFYIT